MLFDLIFTSRWNTIPDAAKIAIQCDPQWKRLFQKDEVIRKHANHTVC